jgi:hypothetical protein
MFGGNLHFQDQGFPIKSNSKDRENHQMLEEYCGIVSEEFTHSLQNEKCLFVSLGGERYSRRWWLTQYSALRRFFNLI